MRLSRIRCYKCWNILKKARKQLMLDPETNKERKMHATVCSFMAFKRNIQLKNLI